MKEHGGDVSSSGGGGFPELLHGERRGLDSRDQDMRSLGMRAPDRYSPDTWSAADKNGRTQYGGGGGGGGSGSPGYGMRGSSSDGDRSRGWHGSVPPQDTWSKGSGGSLMGEYQGEERIRGQTQNTSMMRGAAYASPGPNSGAGLLNLPMDGGDYAKPPPRTPQAGQMGLESQYPTSQSMMHFEERDYSLSGYDTDSRPAQYGGGGGGGGGNHQQRSTGNWQQGGGDGGRGRGNMGQGWRRGKPF